MPNVRKEVSRRPRRKTSRCVRKAVRWLKQARGIQFEQEVDAVTVTLKMSLELSSTPLIQNPECHCFIEQDFAHFDFPSQNSEKSLTTLMVSLNALSREQLVAMLHTRDDEIASLRAINKQTTSRLVDLERALHSFAERFKAVEQLDIDLRALQVTLSRQQNDATRRAGVVAEEKEQLLQQIDALGRQLEREVVGRKGYFPSLGLRLVGGADGAVTVSECRNPSKVGGVEAGDLVTGVKLAASYTIRTLEDYYQFVADLPADADVELALNRRGKPVTAHLRPAILSG